MPTKMDNSDKILLFILALVFLVAVILFIDSQIVQAQPNSMRIELSFPFPAYGVQANVFDCNDNPIQTISFMREGNIWFYIFTFTGYSQDYSFEIFARGCPIDYWFFTRVDSMRRSFRYENGHVIPIADPSVPTDLTGIYQRLDNLNTKVYELSYIATHQYISTITITFILSIALVIYLVDSFLRMCWYHLIQVWL